MNTHLICFACVDEKNKEAVIKLIKAGSNWSKLLDNVWLRESDTSSDEVRSILSPFCLRVVVVNVFDCAWATYGIPKEVTNWMKNKI